MVELETLKILGITAEDGDDAEELDMDEVEEDGDEEEDEDEAL